MEVISLYQFMHQNDFFIAEAMQDKLFIYPTDTLYGIGGLFNHENVERINKIKKRHMGKKLSIIAPSFEWIFENFEVENPEYMLEMYDKYHGVSYILHPKTENSEYALYETSSEDNTIEVRIIKHPIQEFIQSLGRPFISTSANFAGESNAKVISDIDIKLQEQVDYVVDGHEVFGKPSMLIFIDNGKVIER